MLYNTPGDHERNCGKEVYYSIDCMDCIYTFMFAHMIVSQTNPGARDNDVVIYDHTTLVNPFSREIDYGFYSSYTIIHFFL